METVINVASEGERTAKTAWTGGEGCCRRPVVGDGQPGESRAKQEEEEHRTAPWLTRVNRVGRLTSSVTGDVYDVHSPLSACSRYPSPTPRPTDLYTRVCPRDTCPLNSDLITRPHLSIARKSRC